MAGAHACFLQYGFAKTSLDDIAQRAGISRPLIYRKFKNKEAILAALYDFKLNALYPQVEAVLAKRGSDKRETLLRMWEVLLLDAWAELIQIPMVSELFDACSRHVPELEKKHELRRIEYAQAVLGSHDLAEVFVLATKGLTKDLPSEAVLRRRLMILIDRFV
ncbi:TetR/AcrR family transcriptional regulator [Pseudorhodoplanes sinuspersici]|nr:helix-turn-helix domain-containing protein [Pseudorhodoplanes sinuspersici]RKE73079.1 TetR family transcriptional regulator [Pseudorhodoplanes sinuspersici]